MKASCKPILEMEDVSKSFSSPRGPVPVLHRINLCIQPGDFVAITGPSGSGKTTLLNLAGLLDHPSTGRIRFGGQDVSNLTEDELRILRRHRVGMVFQRFCLLSRRTVLDNVRFRFRYLDPLPPETTQLARRALEHVGLQDHADQPARLLSGGEMQRVAIARALALPPDLLLVDEPTGNLDTEAAASVMAHFVNLHQKGVTLVLATHNPAWIPHCTRHLTCRDGRLSEHPGRNS
jgi:putative ABC transport system ATP-binding protein